LTITPWIIIIFVSIVAGLIFAFTIFFHKKGNRLSNKFLAIFLLVVTLVLIANLVTISNLYKFYPHLIGISFLLWYLLPGAFYFYVKTGVELNYKIKWYDFLHLVPFVYMIFDVYSFYFLASEVKLNWYESYLNSPKSFQLTSLFIIVYSFSYLAASYHILINFEKNYKKDYADTTLEHLEGMKRLLFAYTIYKVLDLVGMVATLIAIQSVTEIMQFISISLSIFVVVIVYTFIKEPEKLFQIEIRKQKYKTSALSDVDLEQYSRQLGELLENSKLYLDGEIKLSTLAEKLKISSHTLSQVINQYHKTNFYDYMNKFRVEEVKTRLQNNDHKDLTILAIAYESGFNSKSSFNNIFKKYVGKTPTQFLKEQGSD